MAGTRVRVLLFALACCAWAVPFSHVDTARADVCATKTVKSTTGRVCIVTITAEGSTPVSPSPGHTVRVSGRTVVTATAVYSPAAVPSGESRGCGGERLTPTGCLTWY